MMPTAIAAPLPFCFCGCFLPVFGAGLTGAGRSEAGGVPAGGTGTEGCPDCSGVNVRVPGDDDGGLMTTGLDCAAAFFVAPEFLLGPEGHLNVKQNNAARDPGAHPRA